MYRGGFGGDRFGGDRFGGDRFVDHDKAVSDLVGKNQFQLSSVRILNDDEIDEEEKSLYKSVLSVGKLPGSGTVKERVSTYKSRGIAGGANWNISALEAMITEPVKPLTVPKVEAPLDNADKKWHEIPERSLTPEQERDLRMIENRQHVDPKRFYKSSGTGRARGELPSRVHFGTVVVGPHEFYSARLSKRQRRNRIIDEVLAEPDAVRYVRDRGRKYQVSKALNRRIVDPAAKRQRRRRR